MNMVKRRKLFLYALKIMPAALFPISMFLVDENQKNSLCTYRVNFKLIFSHSMQYEESELLKNQYENKPLTAALLSEFKAKGNIIDENFKFYGNYSNWIVDFKDENSYLMWMDRSWSAGTIHQPVENVSGLKLVICLPKSAQSTNQTVT